jgi:hypothetical protein
VQHALQPFLQQQQQQQSYHHQQQQQPPPCTPLQLLALAAGAQRAALPPAAFAALAPAGSSSSSSPYFLLAARDGRVLSLSLEAALGLAAAPPATLLFDLRQAPRALMPISAAAGGVVAVGASGRVLALGGAAAAPPPPPSAYCGPGGRPNDPCSEGSAEAARRGTLLAEWWLPVRVGAAALLPLAPAPLPEEWWRPEGSGGGTPAAPTSTASPPVLAPLLLLLAPARPWRRVAEGENPPLVACRLASLWRQPPCGGGGGGGIELRWAPAPIEALARVPLPGPVSAGPAGDVHLAVQAFRGSGMCPPLVSVCCGGRGEGGGTAAAASAPQAPVLVSPLPGAPAPPASPWLAVAAALLDAAMYVPSAGAAAGAAAVGGQAAAAASAGRDLTRAMAAVARLSSARRLIQSASIAYDSLLRALAAELHLLRRMRGGAVAVGSAGGGGLSVSLRPLGLVLSPCALSSSSAGAPAPLRQLAVRARVRNRGPAAASGLGLGGGWQLAVSWLPDPAGGGAAAAVRGGWGVSVALPPLPPPASEADFTVLVPLPSATASFMIEREGWWQQQQQRRRQPLALPPPPPPLGAGGWLQASLIKTPASSACPPAVAVLSPSARISALHLAAAAECALGGGAAAAPLAVGGRAVAGPSAALLEGLRVRPAGGCGDDATDDEEEEGDGYGEDGDGDGEEGGRAAAAAEDDWSRARSGLTLRLLEVGVGRRQVDAKEVAEAVMTDATGRGKRARAEEEQQQNQGGAADGSDALPPSFLEGWLRRAVGGVVGGGVASDSGVRDSAVLLLQAAGARVEATWPQQLLQLAPPPLPAAAAPRERPVLVRVRARGAGHLAEARAAVTAPLLRALARGADEMEEGDDDEDGDDNQQGQRRWRLQSDRAALERARADLVALRAQALAAKRDAEAARSARAALFPLGGGGRSGGAPPADAASPAPSLAELAALLSRARRGVAGAHAGLARASAVALQVAVCCE